MRANRREINIFNMSLLDILCGALGAFCFMMLVALPYYKPATNAAEIQKEREKTEQLMRDIEKLSQNLNQPGAARDLEELLKQLQAQIQSLQGQVNQLTSANEQLRTEKKQLAAQNQQLSAHNQELTAQNEQLAAEKKQLTAQNQQLNKENGQLRVRTPFLVFVQSDIDLPLDLYVDDVLAKRENGERNPPFDPTKKRHDYFWPGDMDLYSLSRGVSVWMVRDVAPGSKFRLFVKVPPESVMVRSTIVNGRISGENFRSIDLPNVTLTLQRPWALVGTLSCPELGKLTFTEATKAERDAIWKELSKNTPSPTPSATASSAPSVSYPFSGDEKKEELEKLRRERERLRGQSPSPSASPGASVINRDDRAEMLERVRRERERRAAQTGTASPSATLSPAGP